MAAEVSRLELRTWARQLSDTENDTNVSDAELNALANRHRYELHDRLVDAGPADHFASTTQISVMNGTVQYPLPADFRNLVEVYVRTTANGDVRRLPAMPQGARARYRAPSTTYTVDVEYIAVPVSLDGDGDSVDGVSGWAELIANLMARDVMIKRESDPSVVLNNIAKLEARITQRAGKRDRGPRYTADLDEVYAPDPWTPAISLSCYRLRAGNLEFYEPATYQP